MSRDVGPRGPAAKQNNRRDPGVTSCHLLSVMDVFERGNVVPFASQPGAVRSTGVPCARGAVRSDPPFLTVFGIQIVRFFFCDCIYPVTC